MSCLLVEGTPELGDAFASPRSVVEGSRQGVAIEKSPDDCDGVPEVRPSVLTGTESAEASMKRGEPFAHCHRSRVGTGGSRRARHGCSSLTIKHLSCICRLDRALQTSCSRQHDCRQREARVCGSGSNPKARTLGVRAQRVQVRQKMLGGFVPLRFRSFGSAARVRDGETGSAVVTSQCSS
jgi:hypothetical protein